MIITILIIIMVIYATFIMWCVPTWLSKNTHKKINSSQKFISVIIPARNEEKNIILLLEDLKNQNHTHFQVIIIDDHSEDDTANLVRKFIIDHPNFNIQIIENDKNKAYSAKKMALQKAIAIAKGEIIFTTDADCRLQTKHLSIIASEFETGIKCLSGPVVFTPTQNLFQKILSLEFLSLIGIGASTLNRSFPTMANGANFAFTKEAYNECNGYQDNLHLASGDDEFLLHKIHERYPNQVKFIGTPENRVSTLPPNSLKELIQQRKRWASKWKYYNNLFPKILAPFVFIVNITFFTALVLGVIDYWQLIVCGLKIIVDFIYLKIVAQKLKHHFTISTFLVTTFLYPIYVVFIGLLTLNKKFEWKDRRINN